MATCKEEVHVGDIGTALRITLTEDCTTILNLTGSSSITMYLLKPDASVLTVTASTVGSPVDGIVEYLTQAGDLDQAGTWKIQVQVQFPSGTWKSNIEKFKVYPNLA